MRRCLILALLLFVTPAYSDVTLMQCVSACPSKDDACALCCVHQWRTARSKCIDACAAQDKKCALAEASKCNAITDPAKEKACYQEVDSKCAPESESCSEKCLDDSQRIAGNCSKTKKGR